MTTARRPASTHLAKARPRQAASYPRPVDRNEGGILPPDFSLTYRCKVTYISILHAHLFTLCAVILGNIAGIIRK